MANALNSAREEADLQDSGKYITSNAGEEKKLPEQLIFLPKALGQTDD